MRLTKLQEYWLGFIFLALAFMVSLAGLLWWEQKIAFAILYFVTIFMLFIDVRKIQRIKRKLSAKVGPEQL